MTHRNLWLIDMGDGTWAVCCLACHLARTAAPNAPPTGCSPATAANPSSPSAAAGGRARRQPEPAASPDPSATGARSHRQPLVKEQHMNRSYRTRHASGMPGWGPPPGWAQPSLPGWSPLVDHGSLPVRVAGSIARWWWPTLALASFGAVAGFILGHQPGPHLSTRGLLTLALAGVVVILLTIHRSAGPGRLARATAEYAAVALFAALLVLGGLEQPPPKTTSSSAKSPPTAKPSVNAGEDEPGVLRVASAVTRAVTGAAGWLADLWRQADAKPDHPNRSHTTTPTTKGKAMPSSPASTWRPL
jgi:hypothetical protein